MSHASKSLFTMCAAMIAAPFILVVALVIRYGVNVPFWDQWEFVRIIQGYHDGTLAFSDFFAQHNEHRILFPNLVMFGLAWYSHWDTGYERAFSLVVAATSFGFLFAMLQRTIGGRWAVCGTALLASVVSCK